MALILIIIIMIVGLWIVGSIFSSINPFIYKLWTITNYSSAYYWAVMSAERWLLALRYHDAGFEWTSWLWTWNTADNLFIHPFGKLTTDPNADVYRTIQSRTINSIPWSGNGNIETLFATWDSENYNSLSYYEWLEIPLYLDNTSLPSEYYSDPLPANIDNLSAGGTLNIHWTFRLPPKIKAGLQNEWLDDQTDIDSDTILDDVIVNRWLKGIDTIENTNFNIIPTIRQNFALFSPIYEYDNAMRESIINEWEWWENVNTEGVAPNTFGFHFNIPGTGTNSLLDEHNILPLSSQQTGASFETIFNDPSLTWLTLSFNIINRMRTNLGNIYPFLEWQLKACNILWCNQSIVLPDRFYNVQWVGKVWSYTVRINIKKPVRETSNTSNFTIIF